MPIQKKNLFSTSSTICNFLKCVLLQLCMYKQRNLSLQQKQKCLSLRLLTDSGLYINICIVASKQSNKTWSVYCNSSCKHVSLNFFWELTCFVPCRLLLLLSLLLSLSLIIIFSSNSNTVISLSSSSSSISSASSSFGSLDFSMRYVAPPSTATWILFCFSIIFVVLVVL